MFADQEFYDYCINNNVDVFFFDRLPAKAVTACIHGHYGVGFNATRLDSVRELRTAMAHESGHLRTGALAKVDSPFQLIEQNEYRADADSFSRYLPPEELRAAMQAGYTEPWQLADYFDMEEDYIKKALHYWTECRGIKFDD